MKPDNAQKTSSWGSVVNALISFTGLMSQQVTSFVITLLAAGFLSTTDYGIYTLAIVFVEFVVMLTYTGFFHFVVTSDDDEDALYSTMFWIMLAIGVVGGGLLFVCAEMIATFFEAPGLGPVLQALGLLQPFGSVVGWGAAVLTRCGLMRRYFLFMLVMNFGGMLVGCVVLSIWQSLLGLIIYRAVRAVLGLVLFALGVPVRPRMRFDWQMARRATSYAMGLYGSRFLTFFSNFGTDLFLAYLFTTAEAGLYRFANRLAGAAVDIVGQPMRSFAVKRFGEAGRTKQPLEHELVRFLPGNTFLWGLVAVMIIVLGAQVIETLFQPEYLAAVGVLQLLAIRASGLSGASLIEPVFAARGTTRISMYFNLLWTSLMLAAIVVFSSMGYVVLASAQTIVVLMSSVAALFVIRRYGDVPIDRALRRTAAALGLLAVFAAVLWSLWNLLLLERFEGVVLLGVGIGCAVLLGCLTVALAVRLKVLDLRIFE